MLNSLPRVALTFLHFIVNVLLFREKNARAYLVYPAVPTRLPRLGPGASVHSDRHRHEWGQVSPAHAGAADRHSPKRLSQEEFPKTDATHPQDAASQVQRYTGVLSIAAQCNTRCLSRCPVQAG